MNLTDRQIADIMSTMVIRCDGREKRNEHILAYFKENGIKYEIMNLVSADYAPYFPNHEFLNECVIVERKWEWTELCGNFTKKREQFTNEFERIPKDTITHLVVEDATWLKLFKGSYRSQLPPKALLASVLTFNVRYNLHTWTVGRKESPHLIYNLIWYGVLEKLKKMQKGT